MTQIVQHKLVQISILLLVALTTAVVSPATVRGALVMPDSYISKPKTRDLNTLPLQRIPNSWYLSGIPYQKQWENNCGPVTTNMVLGFYGIRLSQAYTANKLRPRRDDVSVSGLEMVNFSKIEYGLQGDVGYSGSLRTIEALISNNIPVIVLQPFKIGSDINHFRVVSGYNRTSRTFVIQDSILGKDLIWTYDYFLNLWKQRGRIYIAIYPPSKAKIVKQIRNSYDLPRKRLQLSELDMAQKAVRQAPQDPWVWLNLGRELYYSERYKDSYAAWNKALSLGLPRRALWYMPWPVYLLNELGLHEQAISLANQALQTIPASSELYYGRAIAYEAIGNNQAALRDLRTALAYAPYHPYYRQALREFMRRYR
ncbi:TPR repeat-containing protein [Thermobaculum terrenum ATCC BAA-798]|uniref:TPR repeat-containing protein n=2 Tax=Thermobaculum TaxID=262406 RepID=D1CC59_THET1|nr:TPR repeat-containing protein [Thermobaculum terrenum ATCC BAA-798]